MKRLHFEALAPVCPACRAPGAAAPLRVAAVERATTAGGDWIDLLEGMLECTNPDCLREYPVLDGVPMLVADMSGLLRSSPLHFAFREDIGPRVLSALVDGAGPDSELERLLRFLSHYAPDHYGDLDPDPCPGTAPTAPITQLVAAAVEAMGPLGALPAGPTGLPLVADLGCGVGRGSFALAAATGGLVVGVDLNLAMLQLASRALRRGRARYPVRRVGMVYSWREHPVDLPGAERVDFWMADAHALPFGDASLGLVTSLNLIDCLGDPAAHLRELDRITAPGGKLALCTPYDWSPNATAAPGWIGGHSQRATDGGASEPRARALFGGPLMPRLRLQAEVHALPWQLRVHDRSTMHYQTHLLVGGAG
jgi:SAM-dependent methyltransferase